jgi:GntR family transcriptional regulator/MocR family aminotransferase
VWSYQPEVEPEGAPAFLRIARAISGDISRGRLKAGDRLPGSRTLARHLGVHRNTAIAAYDELAAQGWVETRPAGGTYVAGDIPNLGIAPWGGRDARAPSACAPVEVGASRSALTARVPEPYPDDPWFRPPPPGVLALASGMPDLRLVPVDLVARAYRRAMRLFGRQVLGYGDPQGHESLREALAGMLAARRGLAAGPEEILVTRGSQMALDLIARAMLGPGTAVAVEALGYRPAWDALRLSGAELLPVPVDGQGMRVDRLEALCAGRRIAAVYVTPHHQYPTTAVMAPSRRLALLDLARRRGFAIVEDDYDNEFHYEGRPVLPLAHADRHGSVVYVGTLSKILAPGLRLGFVAAARPLIARLTAIRRLCDRQGDLALEAGVAGLIADGELQRHADRMRRTYKLRRDTLCTALADAFGERLRFAAPAGGMALWATIEDGTDAEAWARRGSEHGVQFSPGSRFAFEGQPPGAFRLGFAPLDEAELREAVCRMRRVWS